MPEAGVLEKITQRARESLSHWFSAVKNLPGREHDVYFQCTPVSFALILPGNQILLLLFLICMLCFLQIIDSPSLFYTHSILSDSLQPIIPKINA